MGHNGKNAGLPLEISENTNKFAMDVICSQWVVKQERAKCQLGVLGFMTFFSLWTFSLLE